MLLLKFDLWGDLVGKVASVILTGERSPDILQGLRLVAPTEGDQLMLKEVEPWAYCATS
jgi:hypothetical protein